MSNMSSPESPFSPLAPSIPLSPWVPGIPGIPGAPQDCETTGPTWTRRRNTAVLQLSQRGAWRTHNTLSLWGPAVWPKMEDFPFANSKILSVFIIIRSLISKTHKNNQLTVTRVPWGDWRLISDNISISNLHVRANYRIIIRINVQTSYFLCYNFKCFQALGIKAFGSGKKDRRGKILHMFFKWQTCFPSPVRPLKLFRTHNPGSSLELFLNKVVSLFILGLEPQKVTVSRGVSHLQSENLMLMVE